jgi:hypothetical protein
VVTVDLRGAVACSGAYGLLPPAGMGGMVCTDGASLFGGSRGASTARHSLPECREYRIMVILRVAFLALRPPSGSASKLASCGCCL